MRHRIALFSNRESFHVTSRAQRKPMPSLRVDGSACHRLVMANRSAGSYQLPPRNTLLVPDSGPLGFRRSPSGKLSENQSVTHSLTLPARSKIPNGLISLG